MCDSRKTVRQQRRPRWNLLFAILPVTAAALALIESAIGPRPLRVAAEVATVLANFGAMAVWVRANRSALDQLDACACASEMLTIRVVTSRPEPSSRQASVTPVDTAAPVSAPAGQRTGARLEG